MIGIKNARHSEPAKSFEKRTRENALLDFKLPLSLEV
jgi:hypothetical protein